MIAAPESNSGKTMVSLAIIRAMKNRGLDLSAFKTGPDFVDRKYIELAAGKEAGNLDMHLMGKDGIFHALSMNNGEFGIIEGVMGYFDGIYNTYENSSYDIARKLDISTILVYSPKGEMFTIIPKIKGMVDFSKDRIKGIILNKSSKAMYTLLKPQIEKHIDIKVLGFIPNNELMIMTDKLDELEERLDRIAAIAEENLDLDEIIKMAKEVEVKHFEYPEKTNLKIAIAYDQAFNFYYQENIRLFESIARVTYFSPINDDMLPEADLVYIGGGYPELFKEELSSNEKMINSIRKYANSGGYIYGQGGGLMYLSNSIDGKAMCKLIDGESIMTDRLQNFGYSNIKLEEDTLLGIKGDKITGQEYHRSILETNMDKVFTLTKPMSKRSWTSGYRYKNVLGIYQHINFLGNIKAFNHLIKILQDEKEK